ncbi:MULTISPECIES: M23 family metallopeptidase [Stenotrophomonas]|uniref:M23 family metallopeptidase n=1 Tax=Stenotrophomonas TaxID=40323 RepID=UPI0008DE3F7A|nr:M23 family metallopeptidase [Stenotrophomonas maltophilia]OHY70143.1 endopeptidase [Stenotrophomonas maltophilia]QDY48309.1 M23 family peptidase [Stenotrophomonas maltophilia]HDS1834842.1 M23 family metallopeptidase [Stenotrophomonas maltophilia]HEL3175704.1 M23 family metallopeptidase [Stenotrophomonas maltophilia]HEL4846326.1 M23 family metallopeptidase [Stenotrophomonas maltophilia]
MRLSQLIVLGVLLGLGAGWWLRRDAGEPVAASLPEAQPAAAVAPAKGSVAPLDTAPAPAATAPSAARTADAPSGLLLPVQGVLASQLRDTFTDARSEGRVHDAIDIMADTGTPVLAVADGTVEKLFDSERGGLTIYQFEPSGRWCYYYAHLQRYADGLAEKQVIKRGEVIGYVGSTGNASAEAPHLHFEVHMLGPERQWWKGESINPYPLLKQAASTPDAASAAR